MSSDGDSFIDRWSRRKTETSGLGGLKKKPVDVEDEVVVRPVRGRMITEPLPIVVPAPADEDAVEGEGPASLEQNSDLALEAEPAVVAEQDAGTAEEAEVDVEELEAIDIEALDFDADFTKFMQPGVPERLRQRALRRLWGTNPILANVDGLNDYDEDYTDAALAVDVLKTAYKVGQGYLTDEEVAERDAERLGETDGDAVDAEAATDAVVDSDGEAETDHVVTADASASEGEIDVAAREDDVSTETDDVVTASSEPETQV